MSIRTEKKLLEFGQWWEVNAHRKDDTGNVVMKPPEDVKKAYEMMFKAVDNLAHIYIDLSEDIRVLEGRGIIGRNVSKIITPNNTLKRNNG